MLGNDVPDHPLTSWHSHGTVMAQSWHNSAGV